MKNLMGALEMLQSQPELLSRSSLSGRVDGQQECKPLFTALESLRRSILKISIRKPSIDAREVWREFAASGYKLTSLDGLQVRTLCTNEETALDPKFVAALSDNPDVLRRSSCLYGIVNAYFSFWRTMELPDRVEALILRAIKRLNRSNPLIRAWTEKPELFSTEAAESLARVIVRCRLDIGVSLAESYVGSGTKLALFTRAVAATQATEHFRHTEIVDDGEPNLRYLEWMIGQLLPAPLPIETYVLSVAGLILSKSAERAGNLQERLREYVRSDKRLGDPRLAVNRPHWSQVPREAERRFLSWLARDSIIFFFNTILPDTNENRLRKEFWLLYANQIRDFQLAVSEQDSWKLKEIKDEKLRGFARVDHPTTSAFLMQFEGYGQDFVVVEFSETGNAARIYYRKSFEGTNVNFRTPQFDVSRHLKHNDHVNRIIHSGKWWHEAARRLAELGIRP